MRVWGRINQVNGLGGTWVAVETSPGGDNSQLCLTWLVQVLRLNLNEDPFYANWGIPAAQSVISQVQPDYYVNLTQKRFAQYFLALIVSKRPNVPNAPKPTYAINATTFQGAPPLGQIAT